MPTVQNIFSASREAADNKYSFVHHQLLPPHPNPSYIWIQSLFVCSSLAAKLLSSHELKKNNKIQYNRSQKVQNWVIKGVGGLGPESTSQPTDSHDLITQSPDHISIPNLMDFSPAQGSVGTGQHEA